MRTYWGLQQWSVNRAIYADPNDWTVWAYTPWLQLTGLGSLDDTLAYSYKSQVNSVEVNERIRLNSETFYWSLNWLWGVRYMNLSEDFTLSGWDSSGYSESLRYQTANNLIGPQTGVQLVRGWDRFQMETGLKLGLLANIYSQHKTNIGRRCLRRHARRFHSRRRDAQRHGALGALRVLAERPMPADRVALVPARLPGLLRDRAGARPASARRHLRPRRHRRLGRGVAGTGIRLVTAQENSRHRRRTGPRLTRHPRAVR